MASSVNIKTRNLLYASRLHGFICTTRDATDTEYPNNGLTPATKNRLGMPGRNFSGRVSINMDQKGIPGHIRFCLVVKFIVNLFQSNKIMLWVVKEAMRHLMK